MKRVVYSCDDLHSFYCALIQFPVIDAKRNRAILLLDDHYIGTGGVVLRGSYFSDL